MMKGRLRKVTSDVGWSENPASRTRHLVSNVMIADGPVEGEYEIYSAFIVYRNRRERQLDIFAGERHDTLRRNKTENGFEIAKRTIQIDRTSVVQGTRVAI